MSGKSQPPPTTPPIPALPSLLPLAEQLRIEKVRILHHIAARWADHSFAVKRWSITMIAIFLVFLAVNETTLPIAFAAAPAVFFWGLDAYYLGMQRLVEKAANDEANKPAKDVSLAVILAGYRNRWPLAFISPSVSLIHAPLIGLVLSFDYLLSPNTGAVAHALRLLQSQF